MRRSLPAAGIPQISVPAAVVSAGNLDAADRPAHANWRKLIPVRGQQSSLRVGGVNTCVTERSPFVH